MKQGSYTLRGRTFSCKRIFDCQLSISWQILKHLQNSSSRAILNVCTAHKFEELSHIKSKQASKVLESTFQVIYYQKYSRVPHESHRLIMCGTKSCNSQLLKGKKEMSLSNIFLCTCKFYLGDQVSLEDNILADSTHLSSTKNHVTINLLEDFT